MLNLCLNSPVCLKHPCLCRTWFLWESYKRWYSRSDRQRHSQISNTDLPWCTLQRPNLSYRVTPVTFFFLFFFFPSGICNHSGSPCMLTCTLSNWTWVQGLGEMWLAAIKCSPLASRWGQDFPLKTLWGWISQAAAHAGEVYHDIHITGIFTSITAASKHRRAHLC